MARRRGRAGDAAIREPTRSCTRPATRSTTACWAASASNSMPHLIDACACHDFEYSRLDDAIRAFRGVGGVRVTPLLDVLREPAHMATLDLAGWDLLVRQASAFSLLPRVAVQAEALGLDASVPIEVRPHLLAARTVAAKQRQAVRWEVRRVAQALAGHRWPRPAAEGRGLCAGGPAARRRPPVRRHRPPRTQGASAQGRSGAEVGGMALAYPRRLRPALLPAMDARTAADDAHPPRHGAGRPP